ncbi:MAG TPA: hypothetical protein VGK48_24465 [Terriglobia bacterium]
MPETQRRLIAQTRKTLSTIAEDVRRGLLETVGIQSRLLESERTAIEIDLPPGADMELIARAIDLENVEAWLDKGSRVHVAIGPWYSTKDVDQVVLSVTKVVHVLLGLHASKPEPQGVLHRWLARGCGWALHKSCPNFVEVTKFAIRP